MTQATPLRAESFALTTTSESSRFGSKGPQVFGTRSVPMLRVVGVSQSTSSVPAGYESLDDVVAEFTREPKFKEEMASARAWIADTVLHGKPVTLRTLRLRKGLSQAQLAATIGTKQPHVARIEGGSADLRLDTCRRIARALGIDLNALDEALKAQESRQA